MKRSFFTCRGGADSSTTVATGRGVSDAETSVRAEPTGCRARPPARAVASTPAHHVAEAWTSPRASRVPDTVNGSVAPGGTSWAGSSPRRSRLVSSTTRAVPGVVVPAVTAPATASGESSRSGERHRATRMSVRGTVPVLVTMPVRVTDVAVTSARVRVTWAVGSSAATAGSTGAAASGAASASAASRGASRARRGPGRGEVTCPS